MIKKKDRKYKLIKGEIHNPRGKTGKYYQRRVYRLLALCDIPEHGVKAGDLGGLVTSKTTLSHKGSCWIAKDAEVFGWVEVSQNAYIGDNVSVRSGNNVYGTYIYENAKITGDAVVEMANYADGFKAIRACYIYGHAHIYGNATLQNVSEVSGNVKIHGNSRLKGVKEITDEAEISGDAFLDCDIIVIGKTTITGKARINEKATIRNSNISGDVIVPKYETVGEATLTGNQQIQSRHSIGTFQEDTQKAISSKKTRLLNTYSEVTDKIAAYETDIVKIIKYPSMTDRSNASTLAMALAKTTAERLVADEECEESELSEAVKDLEAKFMVAESEALKIAATSLSEVERRKVEKAKDLLSLASNEASSEQEKKMSFKQAFKQLEGVLVVPEVAVDTFRVKIGLKEIEA